MIAVQHSAVQKRQARGELSLGFCFAFAYRILVERMTVYSKDKVMVQFKNGMEIQA